MSHSKSYYFLASALEKQGVFKDIQAFFTWFEAIKNKVACSIEEIPFSEMKEWEFHPFTGNLVHQSGKFFSIEGINVKTNWGNVKEWSQPIINQPEIGLLGIIAKRINGVLHFLMQAKIEPGNINKVQLSPTLQATKSNFMQVHKGNAPTYLNYFLKYSKGEVLLDQLQSEQGARFLRKRNRNIIIEITEDIEVEENFCWLTLGQIKSLLQYDNVVNMDTRTVLSGIPFGSNDATKAVSNDFLISEFAKDKSIQTMDDIISWITALKFNAELEVTSIPLKSVDGWNKDDFSISHKNKKYFSVIAVKAKIANREVSEWTQPMIKPAQEGLIAFLIKKINGVYHFLVQAKLESGNFDIVELAPSVQCLTGNYRKGMNEYEVPFIDYVLTPEKYGATVLYSTFQSEEGGRFYKEQNKNLIVEINATSSIEIPKNYCWMTLYQLKELVKYNNYLNIQARSLLSVIDYS